MAVIQEGIFTGTGYMILRTSSSFSYCYIKVLSYISLTRSLREGCHFPSYIHAVDDMN